MVKKFASFQNNSHKYKLSLNRSNTKHTVNIFSKLFRILSRYSKILLKKILVSRFFYLTFKYLSIVFVVGAMLYMGYLYIGKNVANDIVVSKSEIVARVAALTSVPQENPEKVVRVQDPETLKSQNPFYDNVKEGDYIVMYPSLAVIYDLRNNTIVATKKMGK